jgi:phage shock protein C
MHRKLHRSRNQMIAGVCAGIAEYFDIDPTLVRIIYVLLSIFSAGFPGLLVYIILWIVMPQY